MSFWYQNGVCSNNGQPHRRNRIRLYRSATALGALCAVGAVAQAQDRFPPGIVATFDITQRLEYSDNPDLEEDALAESDFFGRTILGFGLESRTRTQTFTLNLGTDIEEGRNDRSSVDVTNSFIGIGYDRNSRSARLGINLNYRESDTSSTFFNDDFLIDGNIIDQDNGTRQSYVYGIEGAVGRDAPIGASFAWRYSEIRYSGTDDPDLTDQSNNDFSGQVDFRINPVVTASLTAKYIDFDAQGNGVDRETTGLGARVNMDISPILNVDVSLSHDRIERSGDEVGTDEGLSGGVRLIRELTNGSVSLNFSSDVTSNDDGRRSFLSVGRQMDLPRGALDVSAGVTRNESGGVNPLFQVDYAHELPDALLSFGLSQSVNSDDNNQEEINTALRASYDQQLSSLSSFGASLSLFDRNELGPAADDAQRFDVSLSYRHQLTRDWGVVGGLSRTLSSSDTDEDRTSNTVFIGLQRNFVWSP